MEPEMCRAVKACRHLTLPAAPSRTPATRVPYLERCASWISSTVASPTASRAAWTPPVDSTREMAATRLGQVTQKLVGISRVCSFSITLGNPKGQRAATRKGRGERPSCRATASRSLKVSGIRPQASGCWQSMALGQKQPIPLPRGVLAKRLLSTLFPKTRSLFFRHDIDLLNGPDHAVVLAGGAFDAGGGLQLFNGAFSCRLLRSGLLEFLFQVGDLGPEVHDVLEGLDVRG